MNFVIDFLKQLLELVRISVSGKPIDARTTETVDAYKWFIDKLSDKLKLYETGSTIISVKLLNRNIFL